MKETIVTEKPECLRPARRSFIKQSGVALSGALAAAVAGTASVEASPTATGELERRLGMLEDANAVRVIYRSYESAINLERYEDALSFFTADAEAAFGGKIFTGNNGGVRKLYMEDFLQGHTGKKIEPSGQTDATLQNVETFADRKSARASFPYSIRVGTQMDANLQLVQMARVHGGGVEYRRESGNCNVSFVKEGEDWKISRIEYHPA